MANHGKVFDRCRISIGGFTFIFSWGRPECRKKRVDHQHEGPYKLVTTICTYEGKEFIDATQALYVAQHVFIQRHGSAGLSKSYQRRSIQLEIDIVMQIVPRYKVQELREFRNAYDAIQLSEAGAIAFTRDIVNLHRF